jgi:threonine/homoserine/homoserine lactone efflux protein
MQLHIIDAIIKGILVGLFMAISVGPTLFAVIKYSLSYSYKAGLAFVLGVSVSDIMFVTLSNLAASWLENLKPYEKYIAYGGAIALMIIGITGFFRKHKAQRPNAKTITISNGQYIRLWVSGFLVNTLNPGALITWLGAVTLIANTSVLYRFVLFGTGLIIILSIDFSKVFLAEKIKRFLTIRRIIYVQKFSAVCLFLIGCTLLISTFFNVQFKKEGKKSEMDKILGETPTLRKDPAVHYGVTIQPINLVAF